MLASIKKVVSKAMKTVMTTDKNFCVGRKLKQGKVPKISCDKKVVNLKQENCIIHYYPLLFLTNEVFWKLEA